MKVSQTAQGGVPFADTVVASVQMEPRIGKKTENVAHSIGLIEDAAAHGATLIVLPELANSGYVFANRAEIFALAESVPSGESTQALVQAAERLKVYVVAGIAERDGDRIYNSAIIVGPQGYIGTYRSRLTFIPQMSSNA